MNGMHDWQKAHDKTLLEPPHPESLAAKDQRIRELTEAVWEYGQHRPVCRIKDGACCDCGFFEVIASLKE